MESLFDQEFGGFLQKKKRGQIPTAEIYDLMVATLQNHHEEPRNCHKNNLVKRYALVIEQKGAQLYHVGEKNSSGEMPAQQRVITREAVFPLLHETHKKHGEAGIKLMWQNLRGYYGIAKCVFDFIF